MLNNAAVGADIALAYCKLQQSQQVHETTTATVVSLASPPKSHSVAVLGGATIDVMLRPTCKVELHTTNPGRVSQQFGGVGRNIAEGLFRLGANPLFVSVRGDDLPGNALEQQCQKLQLPSRFYVSGAARTACYSGLLDERGDMQVSWG